MGCEGYDALAKVYDLLNEELDYGVWANFIEESFDRFLPKRPELVLDLACGTGRMTRELSSRGYDMIGVDGSEQMLSEAYAKSLGKPILYLNQDMRSFELYGTVGAVVCCLDSVNYLLDEGDVARCFASVHNYLDPDGLFLFDVNTPYKFSEVYGNNAYILEGEEQGALTYCGWQNEYCAESGLCDFYLSLFFEDKHGRYLRSDEHQQERCYTQEELCALLEQCGFEVLGFFGSFDFSEPLNDCQRWYIAARAKKE